MNRDQVLFLNRAAFNKTRMIFIDGIDYDYWRFFPARKDDPFSAAFTDGHSHPAECGRDESLAPWDGWELVDKEAPAILPTQTLLWALEEIVDLKRTLNVEMPGAKTAAKRADISWVLGERLQNVISKIGTDLVK